MQAVAKVHNLQLRQLLLVPSCCKAMSPVTCVLPVLREHVRAATTLRCCTTWTATWPWTLPTALRAPPSCGLVRCCFAGRDPALPYERHLPWRHLERLQAALTQLSAHSHRAGGSACHTSGASL